jgi:hypothetical protein
MRLISFFKKFFKKTEVPLTPEQELALREQMKVMQEQGRLASGGAGRKLPWGLPTGWETGIGGQAIEDHVWRPSKKNP